jgi:beta-galactosidase
MVSAAEGAAIERYVEGGGVFLTTYFSGVVDEHDRAWLGGYPGPLRRALGIWTEEYDPLEPDMTNRIVVPGGSALPAGEYGCDFWCDLVNLEGAEALAAFGDDFYAGRPAITAHRYGSGRAYYVATRPEARLLGALIGGILDGLGIEPPLAVPNGVEVTRREGDGRAYTFVLNHLTEAMPIGLPAPMRDLLTGQALTGVAEVPGRGVLILIENR